MEETDTMNTATHITPLASRTQLHALKREAGQAGDLDLVNVCDRAMDDDAEAHAQATQAILDVMGMDDVTTSTAVAIADMLGLAWRWRDGGSVRITTSAWRIDVFTDDGQSSGSPGLAWSATHLDSRESDASGGWDSIGDIVQTLSDLSE